jgi:hypothetical protein
MQFSPPSRYFIPPWFIYSHQHPVLKHPQSLFPSYCNFQTVMLKCFVPNVPQTTHSVLEVIMRMEYCDWCQPHLAVPLSLSH